jgi:hypothetical protein
VTDFLIVQVAFDNVLRMMGGSREEFMEAVKSAASETTEEVRSTPTQTLPA